MFLDACGGLLLSGCAAYGMRGFAYPAIGSMG